MIKGVIFDLDGTLLNTLTDLAAAGNYVLESHGYAPYSEEAYKLMVGNGIPNLVRRMLAGTNAYTPPEEEAKAFEQLPKEIFEQLLSEFMAYYQAHSEDQTAPYPGIKDMLSNLRQAGVKMAVVSNKADEPVKQLMLRYFGPIFTSTVGARPGRKIKPDPESTLEAVAMLGLSKEEVLYVGDSNVDMITARNAGLRSCGVLWGFRGEEELKAAGADLLAEDASALERLILGVEK